MQIADGTTMIPPHDGHAGCSDPNAGTDWTKQVHRGMGKTASVACADGE